MSFDLKPILFAGTAAQAAALVNFNSKQIYRKKGSLNLAKIGMANITGVSLIQTQSKLIGSL